MEAISETLAFISGKAAWELSDITHERSRAWNIAKMGEVLECSLDTMTDDEFAAMQISIADSKSRIQDSDVLADEPLRDRRVSL